MSPLRGACEPRLAADLSPLRAAVLPSLRAAWWAWGALDAARAGLGRGELRSLSLPAPPALPPSAIRGVEALLRRRGHSCLEAALVRQRWFAAHGTRREIAIGVRSPAEGFSAHAWLVGEEDALSAAFHELARLRL